jgi:subtilisin family serine protease
LRRTAGPLHLAVLVGLAALAGCGGSSPGPAPANGSTPATTPATTATAAPVAKRATTPDPGGFPSGPSDPMRPQQWAIDALRLPQAWHHSAGKHVVIAIVDSGVDLTHPDLEARLTNGHDFVDGDNTPKDENGHGTHVAGIAAAATANGVGVAGGAPDAKIMPVRVLDKQGQGQPDVIEKGIRWAVDHGAGVVNLSLGESGLMSRLLKGGQLNQVIRYADQHGAVVVAAAGNQGVDKPAYRANTPVLVVSASDQDGKPARFSTFGEQDGVSAPGVGILSTLPTYPNQQDAADHNGYGQLDGTSMASPYVAAVAALVLAQGRTPDQVRTAIRSTARNPAHDAKLGLGIVDAQAAVDWNGGSGSSAAAKPMPSATRARRRGARY